MHYYAAHLYYDFVSNDYDFFNLTLSSTFEDVGFDGSLQALYIGKCQEKKTAQSLVNMLH